MPKARYVLVGLVLIGAANMIEPPTSISGRGRVWAEEKKTVSLNVYFSPGVGTSGWLTTDSCTVRFDPPVSPTEIEGYSLLLSPSPFYEADLTVDTTEPLWQFTALPPGSSYLSIHVKKKDGRWIKGTAVRVKIDTRPPSPPTLIQCYDSLFEKHALASGEPQSQSQRPYFKWTQPPGADGDSPIRTFRVRWEKSDGTLLELNDAPPAAFFPSRAVTDSGSYLLSVIAVDEAGWESLPASYQFVYAAEP